MTDLTLEQKIRHILEVNSSIVTERLGDIVVQQLLSLIQEEKIKELENCLILIDKKLRDVIEYGGEYSRSGERLRQTEVVKNTRRQIKNRIIKRLQALKQESKNE